MLLNRKRIIAVYFIWAFLHLILFLTSGNFLSRYNSAFFPFPIFNARGAQTYPYVIYNYLLKGGLSEKDLGTYAEFIKKIQNETKLKALYKSNKELHSLDPYNFVELDSSYFMINMRESIDKYGDNKYYTIYGNLFPKGYDQYDYSEFIIYLLLPLVITYFKKLWFS